MNATNEISDLLKQYELDVKDKDIEDLLKLHTSNDETFDSGKELLRDRIEHWFKSYDGEIKFKFNDIHVESGEELSICHALIKTSGKLKNGKKAEMWTRSTLGLKKEEGQWRIFHEHTSGPQLK
jgi:PhnB protein